MSDEILDAPALLEECDGDRELLTRWIEMFDRDCQARLPKIRNAVQVDDGETLMNEAHALKGGLGVLFGIAVYETAYKLEMLGRNKDTNGAAEALATFEAELETFRQAVGELIR